MTRLARNLIIWAIYSFCMLLLLYMPLTDLGFRNISKVCLAIILGFFAGLINNLSGHKSNMRPGTHLLDFTKKMKVETIKGLGFGKLFVLLMWNLFNKNKFKHYVLCMVYNHTPIDSFKETAFLCHNKILDRILRKHVGRLEFKMNINK